MHVHIYIHMHMRHYGLTAVRGDGMRQAGPVSRRRRFDSEELVMMWRGGG